jgi:hypothetical protein
VISQETFETTQEAPLELLLALGLRPDQNSGQYTLPTSSELFPADSPVPDPTTVSRNEGPSYKEVTVDSKSHCPLYNTSFIRNVSNVCIIGSRINFTTNILHHDDNVRVGLHTLCLRSDPTALHNSYERQKWINQQKKLMRRMGLSATNFIIIYSWRISVVCTAH